MHAPSHVDHGSVIAHATSFVKKRLSSRASLGDFTPLVLPEKGYDALHESVPLLPPPSCAAACIDLDVSSVSQDAPPHTWLHVANEVGTNVLSGLIAFMLTSTIAVSTAQVLVGSSGPLSEYVANVIDMHLLGTAAMCLYLSWQSTVPYAMGAIDASVYDDDGIVVLILTFSMISVPILAGMAQSISHQLGHDMVTVVPTVLVASAGASVFIGLLLFTLGHFKLTSVVNYLPFPGTVDPTLSVFVMSAPLHTRLCPCPDSFMVVIAGFLSGLGGVLIKDGIEISAAVSFPTSFDSMALVFPTLLFVLLATTAKHHHISPTVFFPILIVGSILGFHAASAVVAFDTHPWLFTWSKATLVQTPRWYSWTELAWSQVQWSVLVFSFVELVPTLLLLISLKYSVLIGSLSTLFQRNVSTDTEIAVIGQANILAGLFGCCGGTHYVSAMALMLNFKAHPRAPVLICTALLLVLWAVGLDMLLFVPKFVFGGLLMYIGFHFLENYMVGPAAFLSRLEVLTIVATLVAFLALGVLPSVGVGVALSMCNALLDLHVAGCLTDYAVMHEDATFVLHLHGYLSFANAMQVLSVVEAQWMAVPFRALVLDLERVVLVDGTFVQTLRRLQGIAERYSCEIHLCHVPPAVQPRFATLTFARHATLHHFLEARHAAVGYGHLQAAWARFVQLDPTLFDLAVVGPLTKYLDVVETLAPPTTVLDDASAWNFLVDGALDLYDASMQPVGRVRAGDIVPAVPGHTLVVAAGPAVVVLRMGRDSWRQLRQDAPVVAIAMLEAANRHWLGRCYTKV
ncbi:Aste57867_18902 [Aphanomyces stellatus]|uniref:Aste57867_18902 protein n=1 Tax=Aphanomyces stellatus TaxID=120398 RepID=A0A485LCR5_9STRA|nr:hypothetical protein As57867_018838 [Aphanomyces stellatus]VFT95634.1 Aste57867_18902 [Aphanomyces stellatus]